MYISNTVITVTPDANETLFNVTGFPINDYFIPSEILLDTLEHVNVSNFDDVLEGKFFGLNTVFTSPRFTVQLNDDNYSFTVYYTGAIQATGHDEWTFEDNMITHYNGGYIVPCLNNKFGLSIAEIDCDNDDITRIMEYVIAKDVIGENMDFTNKPPFLSRLHKAEQITDIQDLPYPLFLKCRALIRITQEDAHKASEADKGILAETLKDCLEVILEAQDWDIAVNICKNHGNENMVNLITAED